MNKLYSIKELEDILAGDRSYLTKKEFDNKMPPFQQLLDVMRENEKMLKALEAFVHFSELPDAVPRREYIAYQVNAIGAAKDILNSNKDSEVVRMKITNNGTAPLYINGDTEIAPGETLHSDGSRTKTSEGVKKSTSGGGGSNGGNEFVEIRVPSEDPRNVADICEDIGDLVERLNQSKTSKE